MTKKQLLEILKKLEEIKKLIGDDQFRTITAKPVAPTICDERSLRESTLTGV